MTDDAGHLPLDDFRRHGHEVVDWIADYLEGVGDRAVVPEVKPGEIRAMVSDQAPEAGESMRKAAAALPSCSPPLHPSAPDRQATGVAWFFLATLPCLGVTPPAAALPVWSAREASRVSTPVRIAAGTAGRMLRMTAVP